MLVSIVTPVYNCEKYIAETIESILSQDYKNIEYIVVDDGSVDRTSEILETFKDKITVVRQENNGEQSAVNLGFSLASGCVLGIVNADDPVKPNLVSCVVNELSSDSKLVGVYPDWEKIDSNGNIIDIIKTREFSLRLMLEQCFCIPGPGAFFRKSALSGQLPRRLQYKYSGDFDLWLRLSMQGELKRIPISLASWRVHEQSASFACKDPDMADNKIDLFKAFFEENELRDDVLNLRRQAMSSAYYAAAILGVRNSQIPARRYLICSYVSKFCWPRYFIKSQQRSLALALCILTLPYSVRVRDILISLYEKLKH